MAAPHDDRRLALWLIAPALGVMFAVTGYPILHAIQLSFFRHRLTDPGGRAFVGLQNYAVVLSDPLWWTDVGTTLLLVAVTVPVELALGLALALVLHRAASGRHLVRAAVLLPYGVVTVVSAFAWKHAFALDTGFVNGWLGLGELAWFAHPATALAAISLAEIWKTTPFVALLLLAGLSTVPDELGEAARIDGASAWQRLVAVTLPAMRTPIAVAVVFRTLDAYRVFDSVFVMTGGAHRTESISFLAYRQMIGRTALGLGSAVSVLVFLSVILLAAALVKVLRPELGGPGAEVR
jgi:trehalose/maltose transport system permease protein